MTAPAKLIPELCLSTVICNRTDNYRKEHDTLRTTLADLERASHNLHLYAETTHNQATIVAALAKKAITP